MEAETIVVGEPGAYTPHDIGVRWLFTLTDPLIPLRYRQHINDQMVALITTRPRWGAFFIGGVLSDLISTLPGSDPWRHLSARWGASSFGPHPPLDNGAVGVTGRVFGTYTDALDVAGQVMAHPEIDTGLAAFAQPLSPGAAYAVAAGALGHKRAPDALAALAGGTDEGDVSEQEQVAAVIQIGSRRRLPQGQGRQLAEDGLEAIRWVAARRRSWLGTTDDSYVVEVVSRWSILASTLADGGDLGAQWASIDERNADNSIIAEDVDF